MSEAAPETRTVQLLEFDLGSETYCVDIGHVAEIVDVGDLTVLPNSPSHVEGVMDLRGKTTTIVDPKELFDIDADGDRDRIVVFDDERSADDGKSVGWIVDGVDQVTAVDVDEVESSPVEDGAGVRGVVKRDDDFVIWVSPTVGDA
jgi:purine-binding chemotaxis protein CheW